MVSDMLSVGKLHPLRASAPDTLLLRPLAASRRSSLVASWAVGEKLQVSRYQRVHGPPPHTHPPTYPPTPSYRSFVPVGNI